MLNQELVDIFSEMASILEFLGDPGDVFRVRAYRAVALSIPEIAKNIETLAKQKRLQDVPGVGPGIQKKIEQYIQTGKIEEYESLKKKVPKGFFELMRIPFLGPKKIRILYSELGVENVENLRSAIQEGQVAQLSGFGEKSAEKLLRGIGVISKNHKRRLLGEVYSTVETVLEVLKSCPYLEKAVSAGSYRRCESTVGDVDILATGENQKKIMDFFLKQSFVGTVLGKGNTKSSVVTKDGLQIDLRVVKPNQFGSALQYFTGSKSHNVHLRTMAKSRGFKLSEYGFFRDGVLVASKTEKECYESLGMQYIPPELRTDTGEIEAAKKHALPKLVEIKDIRGDLHVHSTWSDGQSTISEIAEAAIKRGYEYIAITDHSPRLTIARGLTLDRLWEKKKEIDDMQKKYKIKILFGTEVDILADGMIDYPDEILKEFDIVVASVHSRIAQDNTNRIMRAMENPFVHIIGHPSGRRIGKREPSQLNYEMLFKKAVETGTILEINGQPERMDLADIYIRQAKEFGCRFAIDSDSHSTNALRLMDVGVGWARRGWAEKRDVVNTLSLDRLLKALK